MRLKVSSKYMLKSRLDLSHSKCMQVEVISILMYANPLTITPCEVYSILQIVEYFTSAYCVQQSTHC